jgi:tetratricopeptide (TPR) repeat protein
LEAAEAVAAAADVESFAVLDHLTTLVEKSLVFRQADMYRILETVRGYARERSLEAGESEGAYARHRDWYLGLVRQAAPAFFRGPESAPWLDRLDAEHDNLRAALAWSINEPGGTQTALELVAGLWRFWEIRGYLVEGRQWLDRALADANDISTLRADALTGAGILSAAQGDHAAAVRYHEQSLRIHEELGNSLSIQYALHNLANAAMHHGDPDKARALQERVVEMAAKADPQGLPFALVNLADVADRQGDYDAAKDYYERALAAIGADGNVWAMAYALGNYGDSAARHGDDDLASERYQQALAIYRQTGDERGEARVMTSLAELAAARDDPAAARNLLYDALRIRCRLGDSQGICAALERLSESATPDDADRATRILAAAAAMRSRTGARLSLKDQAQVDQQLASLQNSLGGDRFQRSWRDGSSASLDDALMDAAALAGR